MNYEIILASNSPRRKELLSKFIDSFSIVSSCYEEKVDPKGDPIIEVMNAAFLKGMAIKDQTGQKSIIISADTIVYKNTILGKPVSSEHAKEMLESLSDSWHEVYTGIALIDTESDKKVVSYVKTAVKFKPLDSDLINWYINTKEPLDKAGAYGIQDLGALLVEQIQGDYFNVVGFPIAHLHDLLIKHFNYKLY